ncbi:MAG: prepilin-type N-terminal cleavage/methylation domain-containing protein [Candidatus Saccharibacteria bacterium]|nr:prepilin-type N-terminal cleavage/methylation domain-containing protein [Candidatus Saccharibacteria bacterium]
MRYKSNQSGFSAVELLITLFIAAVFLLSGFELYTAIIKNGGEARMMASASSVVTDYIQRYKSTATNPCTAQTPLTNSPITVSGLSNVNVTVAIMCPYSSGSYAAESTPQTVSEVVATIKYGTPQQTVRNATFVSNQNSGIVTSGLVLDLDAGNTASYPGSGVTWTDLSTSGNNATLTNGPGFTTDGGGAIVFNGTNQYGTITNNSSLYFTNGQTLIMVMKHSATTLRRNPWNQAYGGAGTWTHETGNGINQYYGSNGADGGSYVGAASAATPRNVWNFMASTRSSTTQAWYINGVQSSTTGNPFGIIPATSANISIATGYTGNYWQGSMSVILAYNRALTPSEINQDYNAIKSRYQS